MLLIQYNTGLIKCTLHKEVLQILKEQDVDEYQPQVCDCLKSIVENMAIKILKDASYYKESTELTKADVSLAIALDREKKNCDGPLPTEELINLADEYNNRTISVKESHGLKIPKENLGNVNYQLENPNKKVRLESAEAYMNKQYGGSFTFLMPPKHYKPSNMGGYILKNSQLMKESPMKITIRPKFNLQHGMSMLKKNQ